MIVLMYVLMTVYEDEIEMYNVYNDYVVHEIVKLKMDNQATVVDIALKVIMTFSVVVDRLINELILPI
jgi:hypothetical protein